MTWYYAVGSQQQGPVTDDQLQALAKDGVVTGDTLVWRDGMANWQPYRTVAPAGVSLPAATASTPAAAPVSAAFQPATSGSGGLTEQQVLDREYRVEIGEGLDCGWKVFTANAGVIIGVCVVLFCITMGLALMGGLLGLLLPFVNVFINMFVNGLVIGGMMCFFLRMVRGQAGQFGDAFAGFGPRFLHLGLGSLVQGLLNIALMVPGVIAAVVLGGISLASLKAGKFPELSVGAMGLIAMIAAVTVIVVTYVSVLWTFSLMLVIDKGYDFWPAMQLSRRMVSRRWWMTFLFLFVGGLISILGAFACGIGMLITVPVFYGMYAHLYDANFRDLAPARGE